jgi:predicted nucleic acid-binding protein
VKFVADSSLLVRLYLRDSKTDALERFLAEDGKVVSISELARVEVLNVLLRLDKETAEFLADLNEGTRFQMEPVDWRDAFQQAESLARRFSRTLKPGGHDLVLVAAAVVVGASWFLSFDANSCQRPLAACAGLRLWPPLNRDEKGLVRHAARQMAS